MHVCVSILDSTGSDTIESAGVWLDHAEGFPLSQFCGEWGFVSLNIFLSSSGLLMFIFVQSV